jgi:magnesium transporter
MTEGSAAGLQTLATTFLRQFPQDAARHLESAAIEDVARLIGSEPAVHAVPVIERMASNVAADVLNTLPIDAAVRLVAAMDPVRAVAIVSWFDAERRDAVLGALESGQAKELRAMAEYPPETAGRLMDPRVIAVRRDTTAGEALARLRTVRRRQVADVFVVVEDDRLIERVPVQDLAVAGADEPVQSLAAPSLAIAATATATDVVEQMTDRRLTSLPVVDFDGRLLGVIRHDMLVRAAQQDVAADIQAMVGASREERALSRVSFAVRKRLPWLEINLATAFLAAAVVGLFEATIAQFTALAVLLPVVAGQSGNTGAQALAVTMRGLALREIRVGQWPQVTRKEASVALINGIAVAMTTSVGVLLWSGSLGLSLVIGTSMVLSMVAAGIAGVIVPTVLTASGQDPAQSSSIILTTVTDVVGFSSFLGIATLLSSML